MIESKRKYYKSDDDILSYEGEFTTRVLLYDLTELVKMLMDSGWEVIDVMNSIEYNEPFNPNNNGLVIVSKSV